MVSLILAVEAYAEAPPGDGMGALAYALLGLVLIVAAVATVIVTPSAEDHH